MSQVLSLLALGYDDEVGGRLVVEVYPPATRLSVVPARYQVK